MEISRRKDICAEWMNQWPVLFVTFKDVQDLDFSDAYAQLAYTISDLCMEHTYLLDSDRVDDIDKERFLELNKGSASKAAVKSGLFLLTRMMRRHYGKAVILLIDEYDVPLAKANEHGYYDPMLNIMSGLLSKALKTNPFIKFSIVTGCLKIAKESIFTGTNSFVSNSVSEERYSGTFGFTEKEVHG